MNSFFKNMWVYEFTEDFLFPFDSAQINEAFAANRSREPGSLVRSTVGFSSPIDPDSDVLFHTVDGRGLFSITVAERLLPPAVVNEEVRKRLSEIEPEARTTRKRIEVKDAVVVDLLPRALVQLKHFRGYIHQDAGLVVLDTQAAGVADAMQSALRNAIGTLGVHVPVPTRDVGVMLTDWVTDPATIPDSIEIQDQCELKFGSATVKCSGQSVESTDVGAHIKAGMKVTKLKLLWRDRVSFVLTDDMQIRSIHPTDLVVEQLPELSDDLMNEINSTFVLMSGELGQLWSDVKAWCSA